MKKLLVSAFVIASLSSCHYGQNEAKETLERNEKYKNEHADFSVNRAGEYSYEGKSNKEKEADTTAGSSTQPGTAH